MQFTITSAFIAALVASPLASATVFLGLRQSRFGDQSQVAWTNGTPNICSGFSTIVNGNGSPCGIDFNVDGNNGPFTFQGCGGNGLSLERNHQFNSNCKFVKQTINCDDGAKVGVNGFWQCN
ncbi:hypothetical protein B0T16DRAFT_415479 [Cercophora newfieldiana]|uniref:Cyanovirin-N domain-containing protein n=1 Tax=Cercophora newfieldiana TaxID=92897 RepID=A0AA39XZY2_9PEZI|nr:hypothetical protein B0T16DRAFT_415479 [Cercophora newfieldiana]